MPRKCLTLNEVVKEAEYEARPRNWLAICWRPPPLPKEKHLSGKKTKNKESVSIWQSQKNKFYVPRCPTI